MKTYWKFILIFGILMMDFYLLITYLFKENDKEIFKETENILDQLGLYEIMQLISMFIKNLIATFVTYHILKLQKMMNLHQKSR